MFQRIVIISAEYELYLNNRWICVEMSFPKENIIVTLPKNAQCYRCGKRIKERDQFTVIDGKLYCRKCSEAKRDWDFLALHALLDD